MVTQPIHAMVDTWTGGTTTWKAISMNVTDAASASDSKLIDLLISSVSKFAVDKAGNVVIAGGLTAAGNLDLTGNATIGGTLTVTGAAALGNATVGGTLGVTGLITGNAGLKYRHAIPVATFALAVPSGFYRVNVSEPLGPQANGVWQVHTQLDSTLAYGSQIAIGEFGGSPAVVGKVATRVMMAGVWQAWSFLARENAVAITGGTITGINDLAVADGGTGASTPGAALNNLGALARTNGEATGLKLLGNVVLDIIETSLAYMHSAATHIAMYKKAGAHAFYWRKSADGTYTGANQADLMTLTDDGELFVGGGSGSGSGKVIHLGNDGSGSLFDADLLDGAQGSSYVRKDNGTQFINSGAANNALQLDSSTTATFLSLHHNTVRKGYLQASGNTLVLANDPGGVLSLGPTNAVFNIKVSAPGFAVPNTLAASLTDVSKHLDLWGGVFGLNITDNTMNLVSPSLIDARAPGGFRVNGQAVWHTGNFAPASYATEANSVARYNDAIARDTNKVSKIGDTMSGKLDISGPNRAIEIAAASFVSLVMHIPGVSRKFITLAPDQIIIEDQGGAAHHRFFHDGRYVNSEIGDLNTRIENRAIAWANDRVANMAIRRTASAFSGNPGAGQQYSPAGTVITGLWWETGSGFTRIGGYGYSYIQLYDPVRGWVGMQG